MARIKLELIIKTKTINGVTNGKNKGYPWHYGHFIHDVVLPFSHIYLKYLEDGNKITNTILSHDERQTIGTFRKHFNYLFGLSHRELQTGKYTKINDPIIKLSTYGFGPYPDQYAIPLKRYVYNKFSLNNSSPKNICIIKRGVGKLRFNGTNKLKFKNGKNKQGRYIANIERLKQEIRKKYILNEIILDNMSMAKQLNVFANCKCLIGIHGAGMTNVVWLPDNSLVIEIRSDGFPKSIERLSKGANCKYERILPNNKSVNVKNIINILDSHFKK